MTVDAEGSVWRNRNFVLLLSGQLVSRLGNQVHEFAIPLLALAITGSAAYAGVLLGLNTLAFLVVGPIAGAFVDRWNRKATMIWTDVLRAMFAISLPIAYWMGALTIVQMFVIAIVLGVLDTVFQVADTAALPTFVGERHLPAALGYSHTAFNAARIFGGSLAGLLYSIGKAVPFVVNALSFLLSAVTLRYLREEPRAMPVQVPPRRSLRSEIAEGVQWLWRQPVIRFMTLINSADSLRYGAGYLIIIVLAQDLHATASQIGLIFSAAGAGAMVGAVLAGWINRRFPLGRVAVVMLWVEALVFPLYAVAPDPLLLGVVAAAESLVAPIYMVAMTTYRLSLTPDGLRGRTSSAVQAVTTGVNSLGAILGGLLIAAIGAVDVALWCGGWLLLLAVATSLNGNVRRARIESEARSGGTEPRPQAMTSTNSPADG